MSPVLHEFLGVHDEPVEPIQRKHWDEVAADIRRMWKPLDSPHHSIIGLGGSGKTYLTTRGILPLRENKRVLIVDVKGDDPTLKGIGKPVRRLPRGRPWWKNAVGRKDPKDEWYRLIVENNWDHARAQVRHALQQVYSQGSWTVVLDETRHLTDPRPPTLNLRPEVEQIWLRGRSREIELVAMTQGPRWVPGSFYDQPSFVWIGRVNDEVAQKRLREIGGLKRAHLPAIQGLHKREFLVIGDGGDYTAITRIPS
jgi:hypothetical protein